MIIDELQKANINALKARDQVARAIFSVVIAKYKSVAIELKSAGKDATDSDMIKIINKSIKELEEEKEGYLKAGRIDEVKNIEIQKSLIDIYLPKLLSEEEIRKIILTIEDKTMPAIMKYFKNNYDGQVDFALVSKIAREI